ncbi:hypothetical protein [Providencia stuartii]|uniref:hypothetical protein n=1 Tax=Providencia stuartii TaxID=588 RepID=UPI00111DB036|nr:hypothetical protein [Providencia stuartii]
MTNPNVKPDRFSLFGGTPFAVVTLLLFAGATLCDGALAAQSLSPSVFTQTVFPEVLDEETCTFSTPEVAYPYTQLHASLFKLTEVTPLPPVTQTWGISCSQPVVGMHLFVSGDGATGSVNDGDPTHFGLGTVNGQGSLGIYTVTLSDAQVEGKAVSLSQSTDAIGGGQPTSSLLLHTGQFQHWVMPDGQPASGLHFSVKMTVSPTLNSLQGTHGPLVDGAALNGDLALTFSFGV